MLYITCKFDLIRYSEAKREEPNRQTVKRLRRKGLPLVATSLITFKFVSICSVMRNLTIYRFFGSIAANSMHFNLFKLITENRPQIRRVLKKHRETKKKWKKRLHQNWLNNQNYASRNRDQRLSVINGPKRWYFDVYVPMRHCQLVLADFSLLEFSSMQGRKLLYQTKWSVS